VEIKGILKESTKEEVRKAWKDRNDEEKIGKVDLREYMDKRALQLDRRL
jgi:hypothetical protein